MKRWELLDLFDEWAPRLMAVAAFVGLFVLIAYVATYGVFGAQCEKAFPEDPARALQCVKNLREGKDP